MGLFIQALQVCKELGRDENLLFLTTLFNMKIIMHFVIKVLF